MFLPRQDDGGMVDTSVSAGSYEYSNSPELKALIAAANEEGRFDEGVVSALANMLMTVITSSTTIAFLSPSRPLHSAPSWCLLHAVRAMMDPITDPMPFSLSVHAGAELAERALCHVVYGFSLCFLPLSHSCKPLTGAGLSAVVILIHADCWLFVFTGAVLRYIVNYNQHSFSCGFAIHTCIFFFVSNKVGALTPQPRRLRNHRPGANIRCA